MTTMLISVRKVSTLVFAGCILISLYPWQALAQEKRITNSLDMTFVLIPAGTFTMGSPANEQGRKENELKHEVTIGAPLSTKVRMYPST